MRLPHTILCVPEARSKEEGFEVVLVEYPLKNDLVHSENKGLWLVTDREWVEGEGLVLYVRRLHSESTR